MILGYLTPWSPFAIPQGAALSLANCVRAYGDLIFPRVVDALREGLSGLKDQPVESERYRDLSNSSEFGVVKRLRDNDVALHENQGSHPTLLLSS